MLDINQLLSWARNGLAVNSDKWENLQFIIQFKGLADISIRLFIQQTVDVNPFYVF